MSKQDRIESDSIDLIADFSNASTDSIVWIPDEFEIRLKRQNDTGVQRQSHYSWACLEHLLLIRNQIEKGESGDVLFGTGGIRVTFSNDKIVLDHRVNIVGTPDEIRELVEDLILQTFNELRRRGTDTQAVAEEIATGRFAPWTVDPQTIHDRLLNGN